jgi:hypothetical protein
MLDAFRHDQVLETAPAQEDRPPWIGFEIEGVDCRRDRIRRRVIAGPDFQLFD